MIRRNITALNEGRPEPALATFADDAELDFPGSTAGAASSVPDDRPVSFATHRGRDEIEAFIRRYVDHHIQMSIEDILVNGPPWNMRVAVRAHVWATASDGDDAYDNRAVLMMNTRWGRIRRQEDYEDTHRATDSTTTSNATWWRHPTPRAVHMSTRSHPERRAAPAMRVVIVGGGYVGMYTALRLQRRLRRDGATITVIDPAPGMVHQPFLPEVAAGFHRTPPRHGLPPPGSQALSGGHRSCRGHRPPAQDGERCDR